MLLAGLSPDINMEAYSRTPLHTITSNLRSNFTLSNGAQSTETLSRPRVRNLVIAALRRASLNGHDFAGSLCQ